MPSSMPTPMDTQPLKLEDLNDQERELLASVQERVLYLADAAKTQTLRDPDALWFRPERGRVSQVLVIDAPRGTGKTSLMLTLLDYWHDGAQLGAEKWSDAERSLFAASSQIVRAVAPLDFDPLPRHIHAYAWLVLALERLVRAATDVEISGEHSGTETTLETRWEELHREALIGWNSDALRAALSRDLDEFVLDQTQRNLGWHEFTLRWSHFLEKLLAALEHKRLLPCGGLVVIPIDDVDLHPGRTEELLLALRLCRHPRICYLMTGHLAHLVENLTVTYYEREIQGTARSLSRRQRRKRWERAESLATDLLGKVIPDFNRFRIQLLRVHELQRHIPATMNDEVQALSGALSQQQIDHAYAKGRSGFRVRDVIGVERRLTEEAARDRQVAFSTLFGLLRDPDGLAVFSPGDWWQLRTRVPAELSEGVRSSTGRGVAGQPVTVSIAASIRFMLRQQDPARFEAADPHLVAAAIIGVIEPSSLRWQRTEFSWLVSSEYRARTGSVALPWRPWKAVEAAWQALDRSNRWFSYSNLHRGEPDLVAFYWTVLQLCEAAGSSSATTHLPQRAMALKPTEWERLLDLLRLFAERGHVGVLHPVIQWAEEWLPVLAFPEYGLSDRLATQIRSLIRRRLSDAEVDRTESTWEQNRRLALLENMRPIERDSTSQMRRVDAWVSTFDQKYREGHDDLSRRWWRQSLDVQGAPRSAQLGDVHFGDLRFEEMFEHDGYDGVPTWPGAHLTAGVTADKIRMLVESFRTVQQQFGLRASALYVLALWHWVSGTTRRPTKSMLNWIQTTDDDRAIRYTGPPLIFRPQVSVSLKLPSVTVLDWVDWRVTFSRSSPRPSQSLRLAAALMVAESVAVRIGSPLPRITMRPAALIVRQTSPLAESPNAFDLITMDKFRLSWSRVIEQATVFLRSARASAVQNWIIVQWLWLHSVAFQGRTTSGAAVAYPVNPEIFERMLSQHGPAAPFRNWLAGARLRGVLDDALCEALLTAQR